PVAYVSARLNNATLDFCSYKVNTGMQQFLVWDTEGFNNPVGRRQVAENAVGLFREVSRLGGVDLLVFCQKGGRFSVSDLNTYRLLEKFLCGGKVPVPVAVVVTHLEMLNPT
ncbi:hypothetical protein OG21DRAFT_1419462, partial [Imleria badia]